VITTQRLAPGAWAVLVDGERVGGVYGSQALGYAAERRLSHEALAKLETFAARRAAREVGTFPTQLAAIRALVEAVTS
jgi:hypothetical protein